MMLDQVQYADMRAAEEFIKNFIANDGGHFVIVSDDRLFVNVTRKTLTQSLDLPHACVSVESNPARIMKTVKEASVKKKRVLLLMEVVLNHTRMDTTVRQILKRVKNTTIILLTVESDLPRLALLRERKLAENWIIKPIVVNVLIAKIALAIKPDGDLERLIQMAEHCLHTKSYRFALQACRRIFDVKPDSAVAYLIMGDAYRALDKHEEMLEAYEQAGDLGNMYFDPFERLIGYYRDKGDPQHMVHYMERMNIESPLNLDRKVATAGAHLDMNNDDYATEIFNEILSLNIKEGLEPVQDLYVKIGDEYAKRNRKEAETFYRKALDSRGGLLDKSDLLTFNSLGLALRKEGRWKDAVAEYRRALEVDPKSDIIYYNLALAYADGGQQDNASKCIDYVLKLAPDFAKEDPVVCFNMGVIYSQANAPDKARAFFQATLDINPAHERAQKILDSLTAAS